MCLFQLATGLSFGSLPVENKNRHSTIVTFAYLFCAAYSIGEGPVPLVSFIESHLPILNGALLIRQVYASECLPLEVRDTGKMT